MKNKQANCRNCLKLTRESGNICRSCRYILSAQAYSVRIIGDAVARAQAKPAA